MHKTLTTGLLLFQILWLASCGVPKNLQNAVYFKDSVTEAEKIVVNKPAVIMPGDRLNINITAINKEAADAFNAPQTSSSEGAQGYLVDSAGNIQLLQLGIVHVNGLTTAQLQQNLQKSLLDYIKGPVVTVNIVNFKVSVMGEVTDPKNVTVPDGKITILQAINETGDLTLFAKRENILVIRETNGKREFGRVNISSNEIFTSPYYYLQQNDVVYVEADKTKFLNSDARMQRNLRNLAFITTLITTTLLIVSIFK